MPRTISILDVKQNATDVELRNKFIIENWPLVEKYAKKYIMERHREDFLQNAFITFLRAIELYDSERASFSTYLYRRLQATTKDTLDQELSIWSIDTKHRVGRARRMNVETIDEVVEQMDFKRYEFRLVDTAALPDRCYDLKEISFIAHYVAGMYVAKVRRRSVHTDISLVITIFHRRIFAQEPWRQEDIAIDYDVTRQWVDKVEQNLLRFMRQHLISEYRTMVERKDRLRFLKPVDTKRRIGQIKRSR